MMNPWAIAQNHKILGLNCDTLHPGPLLLDQFKKTFIVVGHVSQERAFQVIHTLRWKMNTEVDNNTKRQFISFQTI